VIHEEYAEINYFSRNFNIKFTNKLRFGSLKLNLEMKHLFESIFLDVVTTDTFEFYMQTKK